MILSYIPWKQTYEPLHEIHMLVIPGFWVFVESPLLHFFHSDRRAGKELFQGQAGANAQTIWQPEYLAASAASLSLHRPEWSRSQDLDWQLRCRQKQETPRMEILNIWVYFYPFQYLPMSYGKLTYVGILNMLECMETVAALFICDGQNFFRRLNIAKSPLLN